MTVTLQQTADAYWLLYQSLPEEVQEEIGKRIQYQEERRKRIQYYMAGKNPPTDFTSLATKGWPDAGKTYDRNTLYE